MTETLDFADQIHDEKYRLPGESFRDAMNRVAAALTTDDAHYHTFREILLERRFLPGGRIQSAVGSGRRVTAYNCFVSGTIADAMAGGEASICGRLEQAAETMRRGGGIGYDFSTIRPRGAPIKKLHSTASGPVSFMDIFDAMGRTIASSGHRRGAQMGVLRIDHPDIEEFLHAKNNSTRLTGFNVSIGVTDEFMTALSDDADFQLRFDGQHHGTIRARDLWEQVMRSTWDWAEPGVLFIDRINRENNLSYVEEIAATNPCGEQPLPPFGACLLGSFNLAAYIDPDREPIRAFQDMLTKLATDIPHVVRAMDRVIDITDYPLREQEEEAHSKRRMGLGLTGVANALEYTSGAYGSTIFNQDFMTVMSLLANTAYRASARMAKERGPFKAYTDAYLSQPFISRLSAQTQKLIRDHGIANSHLISIAPTGTISMAAGNVSSGIEPTFAERMLRTVRTDRGERHVELVDYGVEHFGNKPRVASECTVDDHLNVLAIAQRYCDSGVSKTCNVPPETSWDDFKNIYLRAYDLGCKGLTTYVPNGQRAGILKEAPKETREDQCALDPETGVKECA